MNLVIIDDMIDGMVFIIDDMIDGMVFIIDNILFILDGMNRYKIEIKSTKQGITISEINDPFIIFVPINSGINAIPSILPIIRQIKK
jgi:hypothetical protein